ncbi:hypothetical protein GBA52_027000, partial [Prunus armeniaca]
PLTIRTSAFHQNPLALPCQPPPPNQTRQISHNQHSESTIPTQNHTHSRQETKQARKINNTQIKDKHTD